MDKNIVITILALLVLVLGGYLVYDKVINRDSSNSDTKEEITKDENSDDTNTNPESQDASSSKKEIVVCLGSNVHQYGTVGTSDIYTFIDGKISNVSRVGNYKFNTNEEASNMNNKMGYCGQFNMETGVECTSAAKGNLVITNLNLNIENIASNNYDNYNAITAANLLNGSTGVYENSSEIDCMQID